MTITMIPQALRAYRSTVISMHHGPGAYRAAEPDARWHGWSSAARVLEFSITADVASSFGPSQEEIDLWRKIRNRMDVIAARQSARLVN